MIERRFVKGAEVRAMDGKPGIVGYGAVFGQEYVLYDSPTLRIVERIKPGAFARTISEKQDVRCLFNHDVNNVLGRTMNDTMRLYEDSKGLHFDTDFDARTSIAKDVQCFVERGDVSGCSFSFQVKKQTRTEVEEDDKLTIQREIEDVDTYDVGPVTFPAYEGTMVGARAIELRSLFPEGVPETVFAHAPELRKLMDGGSLPSTTTDDEEEDPEDTEECSCRCAPCKEYRKQITKEAEQRQETRTGISLEQAKARTETLSAEMSIA